MTPMQRPEFYELWMNACEPYGKNFVPSTNSLDFIFNALRGYELEEISAALNAHSMNPDDGRFAPKPADIVRHLVGDTGSLAQAAWTKVITAIERVGSYESIVFDDPLVMAVVRDMGGWLELNRMTNESMPFKQNEFVTRYRGFLNNPPSSYPPKFIGLEEAENERSGHGRKVQPRLWGDPAKCQLVYENGQAQRPKAMYLSDLAEKKKPNLKLVEHVPSN